MNTSVVPETYSETQKTHASVVPETYSETQKTHAVIR